ncbi:MAG: hypothetical protein IIB82_01570 [Bacteroidetes bacterium]|nr:hypothetical protein [Bacteroidota bacterium]
MAAGIQNTADIHIVRHSFDTILLETFLVVGSHYDQSQSIICPEKWRYTLSYDEPDKHYQPDRFDGN